MRKLKRDISGNGIPIFREISFKLEIARVA